MTKEEVVEIINREKYSILKFFKFIDVSTIENARPAISENLPSECRNIVIDLDSTEFLDSHGIGFFVSILKKVHSRDGHLYFCGAKDQPASVLKMVGFNEDLVTYCSDENDVEEHIHENENKESSKRRI